MINNMIAIKNGAGNPSGSIYISSLNHERIIADFIKWFKKPYKKAFFALKVCFDVKIKKNGINENHSRRNKLSAKKGKAENIPPAITQQRRNFSEYKNCVCALVRIL